MATHTHNPSSSHAEVADLAAPFATPHATPALPSPTSLADLLASTGGPAVPVTVTELTAQAHGPRVVTMPTAGLVVGVAPVHQASVLTTKPHFAAAAYACLSHGSITLPGLDLRAGESLAMPRRMAEHLALPPCPVEEILLVGPADPNFQLFGRDETRAIEWLLHELAVAAGRAIVHGSLPSRPVLLDREPQRLARWAADLVPMLRAAGTPLLTPVGCVIRPVRVEDGEPTEFQAVRRGYATALPPGLTEEPDAQLYALAWRGLTAMATISGSWTVLHAGSTALPEVSSGVQGCIAAKRAEMLANGVLRRGASGLLRLTCDVALPSLLNGLRVLTGTNERDETYWRPA